MTQKLRDQLKEYARALIKAVNYYSLATVEFLVTQDGTPYMIEVNTRLQVEHGITESRYGIDLVGAQIAIAFGAELPFNEENTKPQNWAMQVRINCEDPPEQLYPQLRSRRPLRIPRRPRHPHRLQPLRRLRLPLELRFRGRAPHRLRRSWERILSIMNRALEEYTISGIKTTLPFYRHILQNEQFRSANFDTNFVANTPELFDYQDLAPKANVSATSWPKSPPRDTIPSCSSVSTAPQTPPVCPPSSPCCPTSPAQTATLRAPIPTNAISCSNPA